MKILHDDSEINFTPYVEPLDIIIGKPWLTENGPNYIAYDYKNIPLGFLSIGWHMSEEEMIERFLKNQNLVMSEHITSCIRADFTKIKDYSLDLSRLTRLSPTEISKVFGGSYNIFIYVASKARRFGIGEKLLSFLPDVMHEKFQEGCNIRYSSKISNIPSICLFLKIIEKMGLLPDVYLSSSSGGNVLQEQLTYDQNIYFLLSPNSTGIGYEIIKKFVNNIKSSIKA